MTSVTVIGRRNSVNVQKVMWALGELDIDYQRSDAGGSFGFPDGYEAMNPNRVVPTIRDGDLTLYESNACVRYLARSYGEGSLWPAEAAGLARADQFMDWQHSMAGAFMQIFLNKIRLPADQADAAALARGVDGCARAFTQLDAVLAASDFVAGPALSMGDIPIGAVAFRYLTLDIERPTLPNVEAWYQRLAERAAYQQHVMIPFGTNFDEWNALEQQGARVQ